MTDSPLRLILDDDPPLDPDGGPDPDDWDLDPAAAWRFDDEPRNGTTWFAEVTDTATEALAKVVGRLSGGGEARVGQRVMVDTVAAAVSDRTSVVVSAGTGTGKSLGALIPVVLSGRRAVVVTVTKALQDQYGGKDLPFLSEAFTDLYGQPITYAVVKGRSNYLCAQRVAELTDTDGNEQGTLIDGTDSDPRQDAEVAGLLDWAAQTATGDMAELPVEPSPAAWSQVSVGSNDCPGADNCPQGAACFANQAVNRARDAQVAVVNAHLFAANVAVGGNILGDHDIVVVDEAHEVEDIVAGMLGTTVTSSRFRGVAQTVKAIIRTDDRSGPVADLHRCANDFDTVFADRIGDRLPDGPLGDPATGTVITAAQHAVDSIRRALKALPRKSETEARKARAAAAVANLARDLEAVTDLSDTDVAWVESGPANKPALRTSTIDVSGVLAASAWPGRSVVLMSATVPANLARRLGVPDAQVVDVGSPFEYREQAMLYVARHLPDPRQDAWAAAALDEARRLVTAAGGRTLLLFTSYRAMARAREALADLPYTLLTQGEFPKPALIDRFTADETSVLFATMSFWQGVDVPGPALSLVIIDKLPFPVPTEPLNVARREAAEAAAIARLGPAATERDARDARFQAGFFGVDVPVAATRLAQGAGRLIRSSRCRGVVAVLDPRLATAAYRGKLLSMVPPMRRVVDLNVVLSYLAGLDNDRRAA